MSSIRNHKIRSRKTYASRMYAARSNLRGSLPWEVRQALRSALLAKKNKPEEEEKNED